MNDISLIVAFIAGLFSFFSPCVLPLVPAYVSYLTGATLSELGSGKAHLAVLYKSIGFIAGFSAVFIILGASVSSLGQLFIRNQEIFRKASGILIMIFGFHTTGLVKIDYLYREKRLLPFGSSKTPMGSVFLGMAFAAGWTPCVGPILASILIYAGSMDTVSKGIVLLVFYSLGLAIPFVLTALAIGSFWRHFKKLTAFLPVVSVVSGIMLIILGLLIFTNKLAALSGFFDFFPAL